MQLSLPKNEFKEYIGRQLYYHFPDKYKFDGKDIDMAFELALQRTEYCFKYIKMGGCSDEKGQTYLSHLYSTQYSQFLYFLSNSLWKISENKPICDKIVNLNKELNAIWYSYKAKLPDIFFFGHTVGTVLGLAEYSNFLVISQNVTINTGSRNTGEDLYPKIGEFCFLGAGAKIIGNERIGDRVSIGVDAVVYNQEVYDDQVVVKLTSGNTVIRNQKNKHCKAESFFRNI